MAEEEDRILFTSLGVTSANVEDVERHVLAEATAQERNVTSNDSETEAIIKEVIDGSKTSKQLDTNQENLYNKLRAIKLEIDVVASTVEQARTDAKVEECVPERDKGRQQGEKENHRTFESPHNDLTLQQALAADRLRDLKKTKGQLEKEFSDSHKKNSSKSTDYDQLITSLVKEEPRCKKRLKDGQKSSKKINKRQKTVFFDEDADFDAALDSASAGFVETERDELVRKGISTPFHKLKGFERSLQPGTSSSQNVHGAGEEGDMDDHASATIDRAARSMAEAAQARPTTKLLDSGDLPKPDLPTRPFHRLKKPLKTLSSSDSEADKNRSTKTKKKRPLPGKKWRKRISREETLAEENEDARDALITSCNEEETQQDVDDSDDSGPLFVALEGGLKIPETIFSKLFDYQKVGVQWLWELHCQRAGGIIGDEMGLGKTIQVLSFLAALHFSDMYKPSIIICPVTLLQQWRREARKWYPNFHVEILHDSAQDLGNRNKKKSKNEESDYESDVSLDSDHEEKVSSKNTKKWDSLINRVLKSDTGLLITTYEQLRILGEPLIDVQWGYAVLDEGHRIRNPNAEITLVCKQLQTVHRIIMTGAPIQNKLTELWSLFDYVFPGKLGVLPVFEIEFAVPISVGGYANASPLQVSTAYRCAVVLRDLVMPYLLRRMKADVNAHLPKKTEHVLFCSLTVEQRTVYRAFLASSEVEQIFDGNRKSLYGIDVMRKICNHPDLLERDQAYNNPDYGNFERSGKMKVVAEVLKVWKEQGHRVLLFAQTQQMLDILENFMVGNGYTYRRMDGVTPIKLRMALIDEFNNSNDVFVFILTTKVGGLGTNLTGANRVIIFDPDWNPSTDMQARERAWRIGQTRDVTVYRLITRGTIEEKVYHRQIYKHFLTNKILKNPQQRRFFKSRDMKDLFTLTEDGDSGSTETSNIFGQLSEDVNVVGAHKENQVNQRPNTAALRVDHVVRNKEHNSEAEPSNRKGKEVIDKKDGEVDEETNILKNLFDAQGIHSAMNHDVIMNAQEEDKMRLEEQASQVAQRAAEALRQSRMLRSRDSISVPTWTGKSGAAGAPSSFRQKFGSTISSQLTTTVTTKPNGISAGASSGKALSSTELLARIRGNRENAASDGLQQQFASSSSSSARPAESQPSRSSQNLSGVQPEMLIRQICTFIQQTGGRATSARVVEHFKDRVPSKDLPLFKNLLKEIAKLQKDSNGSFWVLKPEYQ